MLSIRNDTESDNHGNPHDDTEYHDYADVERLMEVILDIPECEGDGGDEDEEEKAVSTRCYNPLSLILTRRHQNQPLHPTHHLHQHTEGEEQCLVSSWEVHPCIEGDEEYLLDQQ